MSRVQREYRRKITEKQYKEYEESKEILGAWLDKQHAPLLIKEAYQKVVRGSGVGRVWA